MLYPLGTGAIAWQTLAFPVLPGPSRLAQEERRICWKIPQFAPLTTTLPKCRRVRWLIDLTDVEVSVHLPIERGEVVQGRFSSGHQQFVPRERSLIAGEPLATSTAPVTISWNDLTSVALA
jgi:hypothetical protein